MIDFPLTMIKISLKDNGRKVTIPKWHQGCLDEVFSCIFYGDFGLSEDESIDEDMAFVLTLRRTELNVKLYFCARLTFW